MAKCQDPWLSWINPRTFPPPNTNPNDGKITIEDDGVGGLKGTHVHPDGSKHNKIKGKCKDTPDRIRFESDEDGVVFIYRGLIFDYNSQTYIVGVRLDGNRTERDARADDDVWVGVKTT